MPPTQKVPPLEKVNLHPRNKHRERYDFKKLITTCPELILFVKRNEFGDESIDFFNPTAVKALNKALLMHFYGIQHWDIPPNYLCPPIPGRADYIHYIADLLSFENKTIIPTGNNIKCLDIGVGANCVYPIIGKSEYNWSFVGSDIDLVAIESANTIVKQNTFLNNSIEIRHQKNKNSIFDGIIKKNEQYDIVICNPPFHSSLKEAHAGTIRKLNNLTKKTTIIPTLNFGGKNTELCCEGGEVKFVSKMILQSKQYANHCYWFSSLISKQSNLPAIYEALYQVPTAEVKIINMGQGNKTSRIITWTFLNAEQRKKWRLNRWTINTKYN